jgi:hypothetical protein
VTRRVLLVLAVALLAGCGGSSDGDQLDAYFQSVSVEQDAYRQAQKGALQALDLLERGVPTTADCRRSARLMRAARDDFGVLGGRLGHLEPPDALRGAHRELTHSLELYSLYFDQLRQVIRLCNPAQLTAASLSTLPDRARALRADWRIKAVRYAAQTDVAFPAWAEEVGRLRSTSADSGA